ncbi:NAD(P)-dependent oxidoreductase [Sphingobacterium haloxyli]|uniref:Histidine kinase n=1 Tax=Sphingobacterium haloxyli TaxID=2100533 RepID=A0A2S9J4R4_9SPHI|nr:NAD(P)H-binding protein [Sphingobacterium haloxyli]PRD47719.1 histidine kinase [Sphingobacterium haloxyli]
MKVAVIGATGFVGSSIVNELVDRNITVTGIARKGKTPHQSILSYSAVDVNNVEELANLLKGHDVVISAFSPAAASANLQEDFMKGAHAIQEAVRRSGVQRFIIIGGGGSLLTEDGKQVLDTLPQDLPFIPKSKATSAYFEVIKKEKELDWAYFSPALQMNPNVTIGRTGKYRLGTDYPIVDEKGRNILSVEDVAVVIADEIENPKHHRVRFTAGY